MTPCQFPPLPPPQQASEWPQQASDWPQASAWQQASDWQQQADGVPAAAASQSSHAASPSSKPKAKRMPKRKASVKVCSSASRDSFEHGEVVNSPQLKKKAVQALQPQPPAGPSPPEMLEALAPRASEGQGPPRNFGYRFLPTSVYRSLTVDEKRKVKAARTLRKGARCDACGRRII